MRSFALVILTVASVAHADPSALDLQAQGEQLAKDGRFSEAIDAFKAADKLQPTAGHMCLIALAYTRRELWPQAEIFLARCHERANPQDPLPDWVPIAEQQIAERLQTANAAAVTIEVTPASAQVQLTVSSFAPDETFSPRTIHLPPGHHTLIATAPGFEAARHEVVIESKDPQTVKIDLAPPAAPLPPPRVVAEPAHVASRTPKFLMLGGAIAVGAGALTYGWCAYEWSQLRTTSYQQYQDHSSAYDISRGVTIGLWAVGGAALITGYVLHRHDERATVVAAPLPGGAMVGIGWQR